MLGTPNWFTSALIAMACYAGMALTLKRLSLSLETPVILLYLFAITTIFFFLYSLSINTVYKIEPSLLLFFLLASALAFAGNYFDLQALSLAPNAGYAAAIKGGQIIFITIGAYFLFRDQSITLTGAIGVALIVAGIALLAVQGNET